MPPTSCSRVRLTSMTIRLHAFARGRERAVKEQSLLPPRGRRLYRVASRGVSHAAGALRRIGKESDRRLRGLRIPSLLTVDLDAVPQLGFTLVIALEAHLVDRVMRVADDVEVRELIGALRRNLGSTARGRVECGLRTAEGGRFEIVQSAARRCRVC